MRFIIEDFENDSEALQSTIASINKLEAKKFDKDIVVLNEKSFKLLFESIKGSEDYFVLLKAGDTIYTNSLSPLITVLKSGEYDIIKLKEAINLENVKWEGLSSKNRRLNLLNKPKMVPLNLYHFVFNKKIFEDTKCESKQALIYQVYKYLYTNSCLYYNVSTVVATSFKETGITDERDAFSKEWYLGFLTDLADKVREDLGKENVPGYIQAAVLALYRDRIYSNLNYNDKHIIDAEYDIFKNSLYEFLQKVSDYIIYGYGAFLPMNHLLISFMQLKYGEDYKLEYKDTADRSDIWMCINGKLYTKLSKIKAVIDLMDYDKKSGKLTIEYYLRNVSDWSEFTPVVNVNGKPCEVSEIYHYKHIKYFGRMVQRHTIYRAVINTKDLKITRKGVNIKFYLKRKKTKVRLNLATETYLSRLNSNIAHSYWCFDKKRIEFAKGKTGLVIKKGFISSCIKEAKNLLSFARQKKDFQLVKLRILYWLTYPYFKFKKIWLTYDKLFKGGDCGEYLYKYCCTRAKKDGITPAYVINDDAQDLIRLRKEGYKPLVFKTTKHLLYFLHSSVIFTTHGGVVSFNGFLSKEIRYFQHLLRFDVACIQHGLTVQQLANNANRAYNNMKRYYCASKYEIENLSKPIYGYDDKSVLRLTGIPRYDGLINNDKRKILITPTWRNYIAMPEVAKNQPKPYNPDFKDTDYFKVYNELLSDEKLIATAQKTGYKLVYLLHPVISTQLDDYPKHEHVEIVPSLTVDYEKILTESSLMVTDYSGVQFDFAYMRKPVIYYHHPKLPPHYKEGGFFYDTMGFGELCTEHKELVDVLCDYMETNCKMKPFYIDRANDFFAFSDNESCRRIYDDMLEYQKNKK